MALRSGRHAISSSRGGLSAELITLQSGAPNTPIVALPRALGIKAEEQRAQFLLSHLLYSFFNFLIIIVEYHRPPGPKGCH
jgi:hypothetical protein